MPQLLARCLPDVLPTNQEELILRAVVAELFAQTTKNLDVYGQQLDMTYSGST
jgi:hypothetical protein